MENIRDKIIFYFLITLSIISIVPGAYFPPFYDGIAGWTSESFETTNLKYDGYQLVRDDGEYVWNSHAFFSPSTMRGRFINTLNNTNKGSSEDIYQFIFSNYTKIHPGIMKGHYPHQKYLGSFAYPTHTLSRYDPNYKNFPPNKMKFIRKVSVTQDRSGDNKNIDVIETYNIKLNKIIR